MITRIYIDNYKCLQNFEYKPKQFELIVGANGTGKSTVFEVLKSCGSLLRKKLSLATLFPRPPSPDGAAALFKRSNWNSTITVNYLNTL